MISRVLECFDVLGYYGNHITFFMGACFLFFRKVYLVFFFGGRILQSICEHVLKAVLKDPRPEGDFNLCKEKEIRTLPSDRNGMPSGHAAATFYVTYYITRVLQNFKVSLIFLILSINTCIQRVRYKNHTISQVIVGCLLGIIVAEITYRVAKNYIKIKCA